MKVVGEADQASHLSCFVVPVRWAGMEVILFGIVGRTEPVAERNNGVKNHFSPQYLSTDT
ncbi:MAG: hypothetical protein WGN25_04210 [Candidatus Electrothrix sp. GW3-4]|uniref:hypothetical protein n=1 Tax=Candidatus Electrothrix sp. GW3-4 TaxID=3126740 RepID=UPI0030D4940E